MLVKFDPFREVDRLAEQAWGPRRAVRTAVPIDVHRVGNEFVALLDLPGVSLDTIELTLDKHDLTVTAERFDFKAEGAETLVRERPTGRFVRRLHLGDGLDLEHVNAEYENGVLKVSIPLAEQAKPRRVEVKVAQQTTVTDGSDTSAPSTPEVTPADQSAA
ncbi:MAG: Hsp20/alpha crystallin family protein [Acidimicrobiales bacterium]